MPLMDEFQEERESIKNGTFKQKFQYFRDYYQTPLIIGIIAVIAVGSLVYHIATAKTAVLYVSFFNCVPYYEDDKSIPEGFIEYADIDASKHDVTFDLNNFFTLGETDQSSYTTQQKITTLVAAGAIDIMAGGGAEFQYYANTALAQDLSLIMDSAQTAKYEPYFYYVDLALIRNEDGTYKTYSELDPDEIPDPKAPETMKEPIPVAVFLDDTILLEHYGFSHSEGGVALCICTNSTNKENALAFIDYLFQQTP